MCATVASLSPFAVITTINHAPTADAGAPQTVEATSAAGASVTFNGTGTDPDGDPLSFRWTEGAIEVGTTSTMTVLLPIGSHSLVLTVSDGQELPRNSLDPATPRTSLVHGEAARFRA